MVKGPPRDSRFFFFSERGGGIGSVLFAQRSLERAPTTAKCRLVVAREVVGPGRRDAGQDSRGAKQYWPGVSPVARALTAPGDFSRSACPPPT